MSVAEAIGVTPPPEITTSYERSQERVNETTLIFRQALLHTAGNIIGELTPQYFDALKRNNTRVGNTINYVAGLLEGAASKTSDQLKAAEIEVIKNLHTAIIEHPLADAIGVYSYQNQWVNHNGKLRLKGDFGYMDEIIQEGIENKSGQIPEFEIKRNKQDGRILNILTQERGNSSKATIIKFSPAPPNSDDPEVRARGYQGNDQISLFQVDSQGRERTTIHWFPGIQAYEYVELAKSLILIDPDNVEVNTQLFKVIEGKADLSGSDANIMAMSNKFNSRQVERIMQFVSEKQEMTRANENEIRYFANTRTKGMIENGLIHEVYQAALGICRGENVQSSLDLIYKIIEQLQYELVLHINELNKKTGGIVNVQKFMNMSFEEREEMLNRVGYQAAGCGFASESRSSWGNAGSLIKGISGETDKYGSLEFDCPHCGETNHREPGKLMPRCQECRREIPRC